MPSKADNAQEPGRKVKRVRKAPAKPAAKTAPSDAAEKAIELEESTPPRKTFAQRVTAIRDTSAPRGQGFWNLASVRRRDITVFLRQLVMLLEAGTPLLKSLKTLANRLEGRGIRNMVHDLADQVENGNPLWQAFERHPHEYFDTVFVALVKASEASGTLVDTLRRQTEYYERREMLRRRVKTALVYPAILVVLCGAVLFVMAKFVVPAFQEIFEGALNVSMPAFTRGLIRVINFLTSWPILVVLAGIVALIVVYWVWQRNPVNRLLADRLKLRVPLLGRISQKYAVAQMTSSLSMMLRSGLSMMVTLDLARSAIHNQAVAQVLQKVRSSVEQGSGIEEPLRAEPKVIPPVVTDMLVTGEEAGQLDRVAAHIADTYEEEVQIDIGTLTDLLPVILVIILGIAVLMIVLAFFLPLISSIDQLTSAAS
ncbi:MAG TPA: type II secretion system F family protein [Candidatus Hydrogenedentes bacterium]|nr:type II secretion system F family protein [Candidatus Hydrogenedentota bacterium]